MANETAPLAIPWRNEIPFQPGFPVCERGRRLHVKASRTEVIVRLFLAILQKLNGH